RRGIPQRWAGDRSLQSQSPFLLAIGEPEGVQVNFAQREGSLHPAPPQFRDVAAPTSFTSWVRISSGAASFGLGLTSRRIAETTGWPAGPRGRPSCHGPPARPPVHTPCPAAGRGPRTAR